jgi:hypothetical protein
MARLLATSALAALTLAASTAIPLPAGATPDPQRAEQIAVKQTARVFNFCASSFVALTICEIQFLNIERFLNNFTR